MQNFKEFNYPPVCLLWIELGIVLLCPLWNMLKPKILHTRFKYCDLFTTYHVEIFGVMVRTLACYPIFSYDKSQTGFKIRRLIAHHATVADRAKNAWPDFQIIEKH